MLNDTRITDAGLKRLQQQSHPKLTGIRIAGTGVTDAGLARSENDRPARLGARRSDYGRRPRKLLPLTSLEALWLGNNDRDRRRRHALRWPLF